MDATNQRVKPKYAYYQQDCFHCCLVLNGNGEAFLPEKIKIRKPHKPRLKRFAFMVEDETGKHITGLSKTSFKGIYYGDVRDIQTGERSWLIVDLRRNRKTDLQKAELYYYPNFYPKDKRMERLLKQSFSK